MGKKDRQSMEELWSKRFDEEAEFNEEEPLSRKAKREREKSISPILTVTLIFMALLIILPTSAYLWWSSRDGLSEEPTSPSVEQVAENEQNEETEDIVPEDTEEASTGESEEEETQNESEEVAEAEEVASEEPDETVTETDEGSEPVTSSDETASEEETTDSSLEQPDSTGSSDTAPAAEEEPAETGDVSYYTVEAGDNMYRIALNHGMSTEELMQLNGIQDETVYVGQELRVN